jgi:hypothetical protein
MDKAAEQWCLNLFQPLHLVVGFICFTFKPSSICFRFAQHGLDCGAKTSDIPDDAFLSARHLRSKGAFRWLQYKLKDTPLKRSTLQHPSTRSTLIAKRNCRLKNGRKHTVICSCCSQSSASAFARLIIHAVTGTAVLRFFANHLDEEGALRSFQVMFYPGEQCVEVTEVREVAALCVPVSSVCC